jgi:hypothetical protein
MDSTSIVTETPYPGMPAIAFAPYPPILGIPITLTYPCVVGATVGTGDGYSVGCSVGYSEGNAFPAVFFSLPFGDTEEITVTVSASIKAPQKRKRTHTIFRHAGTRIKRADADIAGDMIAHFSPVSSFNSLYTVNNQEE